MEILCAYIRQNAPNKVGEEERPFEKIPEPRSDIQTAMTVIARRSPEQIELEALRRHRLNLSKCDLSKVNLQKGKFAGALFTGSCLDCADFGSSDLTGTRVNRCSVNRTIFWDAKIHGTHFSFSKATAPTQLLFSAFTPNNFSCAFIEGADLSYARLPDAILKDSLTFGSQDTILTNGNNQSKNRMLAFVQSRHLATDLKDNQPQANTDSVDELTSSGFLFWTYLGANDGANGQFYGRFRQTYSLFGWPHSDN